MTVRATFDIMVHLPKQQSDDIGFLIYNLARLQHHSNKTANVPRHFQGLSGLVQQLRFRRRRVALPADQHSLLLGRWRWRFYVSHF